MSNRTVEKWIRERGMRPEMAAAIFDISLSTLQSGLRGARWGQKTIAKIRKGMSQHDSNRQTQPAA